MVKIIPFPDAMKYISEASKKHLLLGNGFSIAVRPDIFTYGSLYENADFSKAPHIEKVFKGLATNDFEIVIKELLSAATILRTYDPNLGDLADQLEGDASLVKDALVSAVAKRHPDRPHNISDDQYRACRAFLDAFDNIYTLNYDVLVYWTLMHSDVDELDLRPDDGFRHPEGEDEAPYVSWQQANSATVHYLHGALHLFDQATDIIKYTWSRTDVPIVEQVRFALDENKFPLFVAEGTTESKRDRILHNAYLHKALRSFESCCLSPRNSIVIFGHSLAPNDTHILRCITQGGVRDLLVGIYGEPGLQANKAIFAAADAMQAERQDRRGNRFPLNVTFYDAQSARVWG